MHKHRTGKRNRAKVKRIVNAADRKSRGPIQTFANLRVESIGLERDNANRWYYIVGEMNIFHRGIIINIQREKSPDNESVMIL